MKRTKTKTFLTRTVALLLLTSLISCSDDETLDKLKEAKVSLNGVSLFGGGVYTISPEKKGEIIFTQSDSIVTITINLEGFTPNSVHAVHIHEGTCEEPGLHWNLGVPHKETFCNTRSLGIPWSKPLAGDVGNVSVGQEGFGTFTLKTDLWRIGSGDDRDVLGKVVVVHDDYEDFIEECDPSHGHVHSHVNTKIACGMVESIPR
jgi:Cu-Zn family superoxide dismutase